MGTQIALAHPHAGAAVTLRRALGLPAEGSAERAGRRADHTFVVLTRQPLVVDSSAAGCPEGPGGPRSGLRAPVQSQPCGRAGSVVNAAIVFQAECLGLPVTTCAAMPRPGPEPRPASRVLAPACAQLSCRRLQDGVCLWCRLRSARATFHVRIRIFSSLRPQAGARLPRAQ